LLDPVDWHERLFFRGRKLSSVGCYGERPAHRAPGAARRRMTGPAGHRFSLAGSHRSAFKTIFGRVTGLFFRTGPAQTEQIHVCPQRKERIFVADAPRNDSQQTLLALPQEISCRGLALPSPPPPSSRGQRTRLVRFDAE